jgi:hypothetical protein
MTADISERDGFLYGPFRAPVNTQRETSGNIHSEEDARRLGFRGGLVAGSVHMEQLLPVLVRAFGERWLERGSVSLYFLTPTLHGEEVRAVIAAPPAGASDAQVELWMERPDGTRICEGTAAAGDPPEPPALRARKIDMHAPGELRILAHVTPGDAFREVDTSVPRRRVDERVEVITEPSPWYTGASRWGGILPTTVNQVNALIAPANAYLTEHRTGAIGLYGAIELRNVRGPLLADVTYRAGGTLLYAGETPKTEYVWFDTWAERDGERIAEMRMMLRFMKASSRLYADEAAVAAQPDA